MRNGSKGSMFAVVAVGVAAVLVIVLAVIGIEFWNGIGDSDISAAGWVAMGIGIVLTLALGIGLMTLVFISSRRGYDEASRSER
ncbi:MAG: hypothetical protein JO358_00825 [Alphaproteobacteria bacterium]|nr:hypothetical protein [Alphaproteobacteria bacterium]